MALQICQNSFKVKYDWSSQWYTVHTIQFNIPPLIAIARIMENIKMKTNKEIYDYPYARIIITAIILPVILCIFLILLFVYFILTSGGGFVGGSLIGLAMPLLALGFISLISMVVKVLAIMVIVICLFKKTISKKSDYLSLALIGFFIPLATVFIHPILLIISLVCYLKVTIHSKKDYQNIIIFVCLGLAIIFNIISSCSDVHISNHIGLGLILSILNAIFAIIIGKFALPKQPFYGVSL